MAALTLPDYDRLHQLLSYNPESGLLIWKVRKFTKNGWNSRFAGKIAGSNHMGYVSLRTDGQNFQAHRVIWKMMTGAEPLIIDHIDWNRSNNSWANLRDGTQADNCRNRKGHSNSHTGLKGVHWKWQFGRRVINARIWVNGKDKFLGTLKTDQEAHEAYCRAAKEYFGEFWSPG